MLCFLLDVTTGLRLVATRQRRNSTENPSGPGALLVGMALIACQISSSENGWSNAIRSRCSGWISSKAREKARSSEDPMMAVKWSKASSGRAAGLETVLSTEREDLVFLVAVRGANTWERGARATALEPSKARRLPGNGAIQGC